VLPAPIPIGRTAADGTGAPYALASVDGVPGTFPVAIDSGSPLTAYDDGSGRRAARVGHLRLYATTPVVPRLDLQPVPLFIVPIGRVGTGDGFPVAGVFGGDNLTRFAVTLDFRAGTTVSLLPLVTATECELSGACQSVFDFRALLGGTQTAPNDPRIVLGDNQYTYPPTRVVLDACVEPYEDPVSRDVPCAFDDPAAANGKGLRAPYLPSGIDVKVLIATGFPGFGLSSGAYDRLRGTGSSDQAAAQSPVQLHLADIADDGADHHGLAVSQVTLGGSGHAAITFVSREVYSANSRGPCAELAHSRRRRRFLSSSAPSTDNPDCRLSPGSPYLFGCPPGPLCNDLDRNSNIAASVELAGPLPTFVVPDAAPLLTGINFDVRPQSATVEAVVGSEVLARLVSTLDYQNARVILRCASDLDCVAYPRAIANQDPQCDPAAAPAATSGVVRVGGACSPAP
jgi:hypothetical protein